MAAAAAPAPKGDAFIQVVDAQIKTTIENEVYYRKHFFHYFFQEHPSTMKSYVEEGIPYFEAIFDIYKQQQHDSFDDVQKKAAAKVKSEIGVRQNGHHPFRNFYLQAKSFFGIEPNLRILGVILEKAKITPLTKDTPRDEEIAQKIRSAQNLFLAVLHRTELRNLHDAIKFFLYVYLIDVIMKLYEEAKGFIQDNYYQNIWMDFRKITFAPLQRLALSKAIEGVNNNMISPDRLPSTLHSAVKSATTEPVWTRLHASSGKKVFE